MNSEKNLYIKNLIENLRIIFFLISWIASISAIIWNSEKNFLIESGVISFSLFLILTVIRIKRQSVLIILFLLSIYGAIVGQFPTLIELIEAVKYILIFAGLIPTMGLVKITAQRLHTVKKSQFLLSQLPKESVTAGFQITAHFFGAIINTGVFAILAAAVPARSDPKYRLRAAEASLRGMSSSATWSPFFVAFVVGQVYIDPISSWIGLALGLLLGASFSIISVLIFNRKLDFKKFKSSLSCLQPVFPTLSIIMMLVIGSAIIFGLTALSAVIITMPILIGLYLIVKPSETKPISIETFSYLKTNIDDVVIISFAMMVGYFVTNNADSLTIFMQVNHLTIPKWSVLVCIPLTMTVLSFVGIHPIISSTILLSTFSSTDFDISAPLLMQAHLLGWCTGTMSSIASLSVISCSTLFRISTNHLCYGANGYTAIFFAFLGGISLAFSSLISNL